MADWNLKDDLLGFGRSQLKYMLFHNSTFDALTAYSYKKGLFFYDTDIDSIEFIKDDTTGWNSIIHAISQNNPAYVADDDIMDRLSIGTKTYSQIKGYNPGFEGFVKVDEDGYPSNQTYILFEDIEPTDYTTVISAPGLNTRFATEKAIVDYVATQAVTPTDDILDWSTNKYTPYSTITSNGVFSRGTGYITSTNRLNYSGNLFANQFAISRTANNWAYHDTGSISSSNNYRVFWLHSLTDSVELYGYSNQSMPGFSYRTIPIHIGSYPTHGGVYTNYEYITIDDFNQLFNINMTTVRLNKGTAEKYLYLDSSKNITFVDAPSGGVTPVDNILDWDTDAYKPYTSKTASTFYTGVTAPDAVATILNYDGVFRSTQLFEGTSRVMTTHGNWTANGSLHAVTTSSHAGFCPQLPASSTGTFLRDDGTWGAANFWKRTGIILSPVTTNDYVHVVTSSTSAVAGESGSLYGIYGKSTSSAGVFGTSTSGYSFQGSTTSGIGMLLSINPSSTNTIAPIVSLWRTTSGTAANGIGSYIDFVIENNTNDAVHSGNFVNKFTDVSDGAEVSSFEWWLINSGTLAKTMELTGAGELIVANAKLTGLATYADNTAATGGGLTAGQLYKTASGVLMVTY